MVARVGFLLLLSLAKRNWWVVEQGITTALDRHPTIQFLKYLASDIGLPWVQFHETDSYMGAFAGD